MLFKEPKIILSKFEKKKVWKKILKKDLELKRLGAGKNDTATKWHGRQIDTVRHLDTKGHFCTATKWHGDLLISNSFIN